MPMQGRSHRMKRTGSIALMLLAAVVCPAHGAPVSPTKAPFEGVSPEQLAELAADARPARLARERQAAAGEIASTQLYAPDDIEKARALLGAESEDTPAANVRRITEAFAAVDTRVADVMKLTGDGEHAKAAEVASSLIDPAGRRYADAVARLLNADALLAAGRADKAAEAYVQLVRAMPQKVSFAATAALKGAETYEKTGRMMYASRLYMWWVDNYSFLDPACAEQLAEKIKSLRSQSENPLGALVELMENVRARLADADSGTTTQQTEQQIVAILNDLIAMAAQQHNRNQNRNDEGKCPHCGREGCRGECRGAGRGQARGIPVRPASPAPTSVLPGGEAAAPTGLTTVRPDNDSDAWGELPIRRREKIVESFRQRYPQRYNEMLDAYYKRLAEPE